MLSDGQLAAMRATAGRYLPDTCTIQRRTQTSDGGGGTTTAWAVAATVACRIAPVGGGENSSTGDRISDESTAIVTFPAGTDVTESDRLQVAARTWDVTLVRTRGAYEITRRCEIKEAP